MMSKVQTFIVASIVLSGCAIGYMQLASDDSMTSESNKDVTSSPKTLINNTNVNDSVTSLTTLSKTHAINPIAPQAILKSKDVDIPSSSSRMRHTQHTQARAHGHETPRDSAARPPMPPGEPTTPRSKR